MHLKQILLAKTWIMTSRLCRLPYALLICNFYLGAIKLDDLYRVEKDKREFVIQRQGGSQVIREIDVDKHIKNPLTRKYTEWKGRKLSTILVDREIFKKICRLDDRYILLHLKFLRKIALIFNVCPKILCSVSHVTEDVRFSIYVIKSYLKNYIIDVV